MNLAIRNLVLLVSVSVIASCHKHDGPAPDPNKYHLSRIVESAASAPGGSAFIIDFVYDDQQRVDKMIFSSGDSTNGSLTTQTCTFYYNGSEKNPYKTTGKPPYYITPDADVYYYYNGSGQLMRDSLRFTSGSEIATRDYTYSTDKITVKRTTYSSSTSTSNSWTDSFLIKDHNLAGSRTPAWIGGGYYGINCTYDNKPNPIAQLNIAAVRMIDGLYGFASYLAPGFCHNNITESSSFYMDPQGQISTGDSRKFSYKYNAAGLPEECIKKSAATHITKFYYNE
ncbi:hypothetical protein A3860_28145 [Niastella vici]|uniref:DUF4595 domain-containing protein n=1 Tax=Niastella vici TaxID=1703345 RepID=A0A1V9FW38_9BACT|nr:hypothetical protein [Niastella vici]OQP62565.1 hypothetical protein A3860_28145 [Niastella vici]